MEKLGAEAQQLISTIRPIIQHGIETSIVKIEDFPRRRLRIDKLLDPSAEPVAELSDIVGYCLATVPEPESFFTADIKNDLIAAGQQALVLNALHMPWPVATFGDDVLPISLFPNAEGEATALDFGNVAELTEIYGAPFRAAGADIIMMAPADALRTLTVPLTRFMCQRLAFGGGPPAPNITVSNTQNGWQIIYRPAGLPGRRHGLGGPSSPVSGFVAPGTYMFGISKGPTEQWDLTTWLVPPANNIFLPLP
jgi:hypothetical protein